MSYVYIKATSIADTWKVGFYDPRGEWHTESFHDDPVGAANRVSWLNGEKRKAKTLKENQLELIRESLIEFNGNVVLAAKNLGIGKSTLYRILQKNTYTWQQEQ